MIFALLCTALVFSLIGMIVSLTVTAKNLNKPCYGSLHYDKTTDELYLAISDESILDLKDGEYVTLKFRRV